MNWYKRAAAMPLKDALDHFGLDAVPSKKELQNIYRDLSRKHHPDVTGGNEQRMSEINSAHDTLEEAPEGTSAHSGFEEYPGGFAGGFAHSEPIPPWQTDERASYNEVGRDFSNINFCLKSIYDKAVENGGEESLEKITFQAFDGSFFRHTFVAYANDATLAYGGEVMAQWNSGGGNPYATHAVFASKKGSKTIKWVWPDGENMGKEFTHESFNSNPSNDQSFQNMIRKYVADSGLDVTA